MSKINEIIMEPSKIETGSIFLLKIKSIRYATYQELKSKSYQDIKSTFSYRELKGD